MLKQSASDGSICAENKQTLEVFLLSLFSFFSTDAMQRYVMFGSSEAGHHCLWRLLAGVSVTEWGHWINAQLFLKGTERQGITSRNKRKHDVIQESTIYFKTCTLFSAQWLLNKSKPIIRQNSKISLGTVSHCKLEEDRWYGPLCVWAYSSPRLYVRCQFRHSNFLKVITESHNVFQHKLATNSSY